jgi:hypothetical protein
MALTPLVENPQGTPAAGHHKPPNELSATLATHCLSAHDNATSSSFPFRPMHSATTFFLIFQIASLA